jgi:PmbA protein
MEPIPHCAGEECESYSQEGTVTRIILSNHRISSIEKRYIRGIGFRVFINGHQGFAYTTDMGRTRETIELARRCAQSSSEVKRIPVPENHENVEHLLDPELSEIDVETAAEMALEICEGAEEESGRVVYGSVEITHLTHEILTSYGISGMFGETLCCAGVDVEVGDSLGTETLYTRQKGDLFFELGKNAAHLAYISKNPQNLEEKASSVILRPPALSKFLENAIVPSLLADNVEKGVSIFKERIDEPALSRITIIDDGTVAGGIGSRPFDGEGCPCRKTTVIEKGVLKSFLHDTTTAFAHNCRSTGNAMRSSFSTPPTIYISNLVLKPDKKTDELLSTMEYGVLVKDIVGSFSFNFTTGKFGFEGKNAFLIRKGDIEHPVGSITVLGNIEDVIRTIELGNDVKHDGRFVIPSGKIEASVSC